MVNWWMSYLNFQIEHHMFPSMPQFRHPVRAMCDMVNLVFQYSPSRCCVSHSGAASVWKNIMVLANIYYFVLFSLCWWFRKSPLA